MSKQSLISELSEEQLDELLAYTPNFSERSLENIKRLSLEKISTQEKQIKKNFSMKKAVSIAAVAVLLLVTSTIIFAATGGLEQFLSRFNPNFGEFAIAPLEPAIAEDQGIRLEVVGAQQIDNVVLLYIAMQDVSGENRLTRNMTPDIEINMSGETVSVSTSGRILEFNRSTNTIYYEFILAAGIDIPHSNTLGLIMTAVLDGGDSQYGQMQRLVKGNWEVTVNTSDLGIQPLIWTDLKVGDFHIEYMSLSPFGMRAIVNHTTDERPDFIFMDAEIELKNRSRNIRPQGLSGGTSEDRTESSLFANFNAPIDINVVTAVIINGERIPVSTIEFDDVPDETPSAINIPTANDGLGTYNADDGLSRVVLLENNRFFIEGRPEISYNPTGSYEIDGNKLYLNVSENQQFIFSIYENNLIFESGEWLENWIAKETVFTLLEDE